MFGEMGTGQFREAVAGGCLAITPEEEESECGLKDAG